MPDESPNPSSSRVLRKPPRKKDNCSNAKCTSKKSESDSFISCDICSAKYHKSCTNLDTTICDLISANKHKGLFWKCEKCVANSNETSSSIVESINKQAHELTDLKKEFANLKAEFTENMNHLITEVGTNKTNVNEGIKSYTEALTANLVQQNTETTEVMTAISNDFKNLQNNIESKLDKEREMQLRQKKKTNVCIFNIPELTSNDNEKRRKHDIAVLKKIFSGKTVIKPEDLQDIYRKGEYDASKKVRPIIIRFTTMEKRSEVLGLRNLTYQSEDLTETRVYVSPDRTISQQATHRKLVTELKERKANGEKDITIMNERIVKYTPPFRKNPQMYWGDQPSGTSKQLQENKHPPKPNPETPNTLSNQGSSEEKQTDMSS